MKRATFEIMLTGGHHNSLGQTVEVVDLVLSDPKRLKELYDCYFSEDEVVRLRTSSAIKRVSLEHPEWLEPYIDRFIEEIANIDQASTQWTLANLFATLHPRMSRKQKAGAIKVMKRNLANHDDWIVLINTMQTLFDWAKNDSNLKKWLVPHLERLSADKRKSVAGRAKKLL